MTSAKQLLQNNFCKTTAAKYVPMLSLGDCVTEIEAFQVISRLSFLA
jgi:hypothetical protein